MKSQNLVIASVGCVVFLAGCTIGPEALTRDERAEIIAKDRAMLLEPQVPIEEPISIYEAMARTLANNIGYRVQLMEEAIALGQFDLAKNEMLPQLTGTVEAVDRDAQSVSSSRSFLTQQQSLEPSTSQDRSRVFGDLTFAWNLLDFGVSYYQAKQEANRAMIARELRRKSMQTLLLQVRSAYWQAAGAQRFEDEIRSLIEDANGALESAREIERQRLQEPIAILRFQRSLIEVVRQMEGLLAVLQTAKNELASLMGVAPGVEYTLLLPGEEDLSMPSFFVDLEQLEIVAFDQRPEIREEIYRGRITGDEKRKILLRALPGLEIRASRNYDSNSFLRHNWWREIGLNVSANIIEILTVNQKLEQADNQSAADDMRRLSVGAAILSQVRISLAQYQSSQEELKRRGELSQLEARILELVASNASNDNESQLERIRTQATSISSRLERQKAFADAQASFGRLLVSLGVDPLPADVNTNDKRELKALLRERMSVWETGAITLDRLVIKSGEDPIETTSVSTDAQ